MDTRSLPAAPGRRALIAAVPVLLGGSVALLSSSSANATQTSTVQLKATGGLVGNGKADDAPRLRAILKDAGSDSRTLSLPAGEYRLASDVTVPANISLDLSSGAVLKPDESAKVLVKGAVTAPASKAFAGKVVFTADSAQTRLLPQWWGALADGEADDAPALQEALNAARDAGGSMVFLEAGTYSIRSGLRIYRNTHLKLDHNATIIRGAATDGILLNGDPGETYNGYSGHGGITIEGGTLDGNLTKIADPFSAISFGHAENILVRDVTFRDVSWAHALEINSTRHALIEHCRFLGYMDSPDGSRYFSEAIQIDIPTNLSFPAFGAWDGTPCTDITIRSCYFGASGTPGTAAWPCGVGEHGAVHDVFSNNIKIESNTFEGLTYWGVRTFQWRDVSIVDNTFIACAGGATLSTATPNSLSTKDVDGVQHGDSQPNSRVTIARNFFRGSGSAAIAAYGRDKALNESLIISENTIDGVDGSGIRLVLASDSIIHDNVIRGARRAVHVDGCRGLDVRDNTITDASVNAIEVTEGDALTLDGNTIRTIGMYGALLAGVAGHAVLTRNLIVDVSQAEAKRYDGVFLSGSVSSALIEGNMVHVGGSVMLRNGLQIGASNKNVRTFNNRLDGAVPYRSASTTSKDAMTLVSPNGSTFLITVGDDGTLSAAAD